VEVLRLVSVVIPTYNECENIVPLLERVTPLADEVIVVDDNSADGTGQLARSFGGNVKTIIRPSKMGLSSAILRGVSEARDEDIIVMDADFSHPPDVIPQIATSLMDHDIVIASRDKIIGWGAQRHLASKVATLLAQALFFRGRIDDPMSGFFGAKKSILQKYGDKVSPRGYKALFTIMKHYVHDCGYDRVTSVDYTFINRRCGDSKLSMNEIVDYLRSLINVKVPAPSLKLPRLVFEPSYAMHERVQPSGYCSFVMRVL
jgi:dolichol-phosphate mannosyltransferase